MTMGTASPSALCKFILFLSFVSVVLYIVGVACPYWLSASFVIVGAGGLPVESNMGLFTACNDINFGTHVTSDCSGEDARDWQFVAAALAIVGLVLAFLASVASTLVVCISKFKGSAKIQVLSTVLNFLSASAAVVPLILYGLNRRFMVDARFPSELKDYDIDWAFSLSAACAFLFMAVFTLNVIDLIISDHSDSSVGSGIEHYDAYSRPTVSTHSSGVALVGRTS